MAMPELFNFLNPYSLRWSLVEEVRQNAQRALLSLEKHNKGMTNFIYVEKFENLSYLLAVSLQITESIRMASQEKVRAKGGTSLVNQVSTILREEILSGRFGPGQRLPSELELTETHGVSRTVVREAVTALRCDGLVEVRQGAGIFVLRKPEVRSPDMRVEKARISSDLEVLEIRTPLEIEAAGLAATRRSPSQEEAILDCHAKVFRCIEQQHSIRDADLALHLAIAAATNNPLFTQFLELHGPAAIPQSKAVPSTDQADQTAYRRLIHREHEAIVVAISDRNEQAAKLAMQEHLRGSQQRYRDMMRDLRGIASS